MGAQFNDIFYAERLGIPGNLTGLDIVKLVPIIIPISGQFLLDPNEINGWGAIGIFDNTNTQDLGNVGANALNRNAGGICFPFDVRIKRLAGWHRNNNAAAQAWGWVLARQSKTPSSNATSNIFMLDESVDRGAGFEGQFNLRDYGNNQNQFTDLTNFNNDVIPAFEVIVLGVGAPTAVTTNRYVQVQSMFLEFERLT